MAVNLAPIEGTIELKDQFTSELGLAELALKSFGETNAAVVGGIAIGATLIVSSLTAIVVATKELGERGSDIVDVEQTLDHFAGSAQNASAIMEELRKGTKDTVDDFLLAKDAAKLLSAGVKLTADDFGMLSQAAFVLQNRGLGTTVEMMEVVSNALVTGRTKALARAVGVIDSTRIEDEYAASLGTTAEFLSETGKAEAKRLTVMDLLRHAVKDAGVQERDFGEQLEFAEAKAQNWIDSLSVAVAQSPVFAAGLQSITEALQTAFGSDGQDSIEAIVHFLEEGVKVALTFAQGGIEIARIFLAAFNAIDAAWQGLRLTANMTIVNILDGLGQLSTVLESIHLVPEGTTESIANMKAGFESLTPEIVKAADAAVDAMMGHSEFNTTLDTLEGTIINVRAAMDSQTTATNENSEATRILKSNADQLAQTEKALGESSLNTAKIQQEAQKIADKSIQETMVLWNQYFDLRMKHGLSANEEAKSQINSWFDNEVAKIKDSDTNWMKHYEALEAVAKEKYDAVGLDFAMLRDKSIDGQEEMAENARKNYRYMESHASSFTRQALQEQLEKVHELEAAAQGFGDTYTDALKRSAAAAAELTEAEDEAKKAAEELKRARNAGGSTGVTRANIDGLAYWSKTGQFVKIPADIATEMAERGFSAEEIIAAYRSGTTKTWIPQGPRIPGFAEGGMVAIKVGERGPETVRVPLGSQVFPTGSGKGSVTNNFFVNGTAEDVARKISNIIMRDLAGSRQYSLSS